MCSQKNFLFFPPEFYQFTPTTYQNKKAQAVKRNQMTTLVADEEVY